MTRDEARQEIRRRISCTDYLTKSKGGLYVCPYCGSGTGKHGTGALKVYDTNTWTCHACGKSGDVIDLYQQQTGADHNTALYLLAQKIGVNIDGHGDGIQTPSNLPKSERNDEKSINVPLNDKNSNTGKIQGVIESEAADYTKYYMKCRKNLDDPAALSYLSARGITPETAAACWIGFDPVADPANHPGDLSGKKHFTSCPRLIIPTSKGHYVGRRIDGGKEYAKINAKDSTPGIFNARALYAQEAQEVFVTEGAFDALSVMEAGAQAIALNSAGNVKALLEQLEERRTGATLILCPDSDSDPKTAEKVKREFDDLAAGLRRLNITHITADINGAYKDANEHLTGDRAKFLQAVQTAREKTAAKPDNIAQYINTLMAQDIKDFTSTSDVKTGFCELDVKAGGMFPGLYVVAAISSLGKTTFCHQIADQIAAGGRDVLFFSLEMSRLEMVSKSIARGIKRAHEEKNITSLQIRKGYKGQEVQEAVEEYSAAVKDRFSVIEGNFKCDIAYIGDYVRRYIKRTDSRPVIFIDYLQLLQPATDSRGRRETTKETMDTAVRELKRLSRELNLIIFVISSVNRANYQTPIDFESIKESGGIEYTADVIWGLQLACLNDPIFDTLNQTKIKEKRKMIKEAKAENPRKIELVCLKNRYGIANFTTAFYYYPACDYFEESGDHWEKINEEFERI